MEREQIWQATIDARKALAAHLVELTPEEWAHPSLCTGWTIKDVAAHVMLHPTFRWRELPAMFGRNLGRSYDAMIDRETRRISARLTPADVLAQYEEYADSHRHVPVTTSVEPMLDILVHTQDILRPLGRSQDMPPVAASVSADRALLLGALTGWSSAKKLRLVATDIEWSHGRKGPEVRGPMQELLMISTGRAPDAALVSGEGLAQVR